MRSAVGCGAGMPAGKQEDRTMYRFLECTAAQYMTRSVATITRHATMAELGKLFEKHDFNSFPVPRRPAARHHLARGCHARPQRDDQGCLRLQAYATKGEGNAGFSDPRSIILRSAGAWH